MVSSDLQAVPRELALDTESGAGGAAQPRARPWALRAVALWFHRYVGLAMTVFLVVAGVTGSLLAFYRELDVVLNPGLYAVSAPAPQAQPLDPFQQREALQRQLPSGLWAHRLYFDSEPGQATLFDVSAAPGVEHTGDDEIFVDPYSGQVKGSRRWGDLSQGLRNLMPFVYRLHYSLALGEVGTLLFGIAALLWTLDCFVGVYLTFPMARRAAGRRGAGVWLSRWKPAWLVKGGQLFSWVFTWHRASGLWVWGMLLVFAWSGVGLNLREVYDPVMNAAFGSRERTYDRLPKHEPPLMEPGLDWREAHRRGRQLMAEQAELRGFEIYGERRIRYNPEAGAFQYQVQSSLDVSERRFGATNVWFDGRSGEFLGFDAPTGQNAGQTITTWLYQLHFGTVAVLGLPYRVFVCLMGIAVTLLSVTGVWVWWVKRAKRVRRGKAALELASSNARAIPAA